MSIEEIAFLLAIVVCSVTMLASKFKEVVRSGDKRFTDAVMYAALAFFGMAIVIDLGNLIGIDLPKRWMAYVLAAIHFTVFATAIVVGKREHVSGKA